MTKPNEHRRRPNLTCTFTPLEVRAVDDLLLHVLLLTGDPELHAIADVESLATVSEKFARMREKSKGLNL